MWIRSVPSSSAHWASIRHIAILLLLLAGGEVAVATDCRQSTRGWERMHHISIALVRENGQHTDLRVRIADEPYERSAGFQHICPEIIGRSAILFVYSQPVNRSFHMNNVHAELDIGFFDSDGKLLQVQRMKPQSDESLRQEHYQPNSKFRYALETRAGFFVEHGLLAGTTTLSFR